MNFNINALLCAEKMVRCVYIASASPIGDTVAAAAEAELKSTITRGRKGGACVAYIYVHALAKDVFLCEDDLIVHTRQLLALRRASRII